MKKFIQATLTELEIHLKHHNHAAGIVFVAATALMMMLLIVIIQSYALQGQAIEQYIYTDRLVRFQYFSIALVVFYLVAGFSGWHMRHQATDSLKLALILTTVMLVTMTYLTLLYGLKDTPLVILLVSVIALARMWFPNRIVLPGTLLGAIMIIGNELMVRQGLWSYAPLLKTPVMTTQYINIWWLVWATILFNLVSLFVSIQLFFIFALNDHYTLQLKEWALIDALTGLHNRAACIDELEKIGAKQRKTAQTACLCICDIDHFKKINDNWGHAIGDQVLICLGEMIKQQAQHGHYFAARIGGEEFVLLMECDLDEGHHLAEQLRQQFEREQFIAEEQVFHATLSVGLTMITHGNGEEALRIADHCLYQAKQLGRNRIVIHSTA